MENPRDEPNLPSSVAIHQCKVALVVVFSLSTTPLDPHAPSWVAETPWNPTFVTYCWDFIIAARFRFQVMLSSFLTIFVDHSPLFPICIFPMGILV